MSDQEKHVGGVPCPWCCGGSVLDIGPGVFRDYDSDYADGIPVCGGCGGLGIMFADPAFRQKTQAIIDLRFAYCPIDKPVPHPVVRKATLLELIEKITDLYREYGDPNKDCLAKRFIDDKALLPRVQNHQAHIDALAKAFQENPPVIEALREPIKAYIVDGDYERAESAFQEALKQLPDSSEVAHDYAVFLANSRGVAYALPWFQRSTTLLPAKTLHYIQTARCLVQLHQMMEAQTYIRKAIQCPDAASYANIQEFSKLVDDEKSNLN